MPERVHDRFCQQILGNDKHVPAALVKAELAHIYPIMDQIPFWQHVLRSNPGSLRTNRALLASFEIDRSGITSYCIRVTNLLSVLNAKQMKYPKKKHSS